MSTRPVRVELTSACEALFDGSLGTTIMQQSEERKARFCSHRCRCEASDVVQEHVRGDRSSGFHVVVVGTSSVIPLITAGNCHTQSNMVIRCNVLRDPLE